MAETRVPLIHFTVGRNRKNLNLKGRWVTFCFNLYFSTVRTERFMVRNKAKLRREKFKRKLASLNNKWGRSKHPKKSTEINKKKQKCFTS